MKNVPLCVQVHEAAGKRKHFHRSSQIANYWQTKMDVASFNTKAHITDREQRTFNTFSLFIFLCLIITQTLDVVQMFQVQGVSSVFTAPQGAR